MIEGIPLSLADMSGWGLLVVLVAINFIGLFRGWVVPKSFYDLLVKRADHLEATVDNQRETIALQAKTIDKQTAIGNTVVRVMSSVQDAREDAMDARELDREGGSS